MHASICLKDIATPLAVHLYPLLNNTTPKKKKKQKKKKKKKRKEKKRKQEKKKEKKRGIGWGTSSVVSH